MEKSNWISVKKKLPPDNEKVIVAFQIGKIKNHGVDIASYLPEEKEWYWTQADEPINAAYKIVAWQPLPSPPVKTKI